MATKHLFRTRICRTWARSETIPILRIDFVFRARFVLTPGGKRKITPFRGSDQSLYFFMKILARYSKPIIYKAARFARDTFTRPVN